MLNLSEKQIRREEAVSEDDFSISGSFKAISGLLGSNSYNDQTAEEIIELKRRYERNGIIDDFDKRVFKQRIVSQAVVSAWQACMKNQPTGDMQPEVVGDESQNFTFLIRWIPTQAGAEPVKVISVANVNLSPRNTIHLKPGAMIAPYTGIQQEYERIDADKPASITITLQGHSAITYEIASTAYRKTDQPIGTVICSLIKYEKFSEIYNRPEDRVTNDTSRLFWVPAEGRPIHGSEYQKMSLQTNALDLRGAFVRGINSFANEEPYSLPDDKKDPDGNRTVGSYQSDSYQAHTHGVPSKHNGFYKTGEVRSHGTNGGGEYGFTQETNSAGAATETRPKNVATFFYVRIN